MLCSGQMMLDRDWSLLKACRERTTLINNLILYICSFFSIFGVFRRGRFKFTELVPDPFVYNILTIKYVQTKPSVAKKERQIGLEKKPCTQNKAISQSGTYLDLLIL